MKERRGENEHPFEYLKRPEYSSATGADIVKKNKGYLKTLGLNIDSSVEEIRRVAISTRRQMQEKGLNVESVKALEWVLKRTGDCNNEPELLWFLLDDVSFEKLENFRRGA